MTNEAEILRRIANLIRCGRVHEVRHARPPRVRVATGDLVTGWLPWVERRAGTTRSWNPPTQGEQVVVLCPEGDLSAGIVMYGLESQDHPAPSDNPDEWVEDFPDGARITYNHVSGALTARGIKSGAVEASETLTLTCPDIKLDGNVTVTGLFTYQAGMSGKNGGVNGTKITGDLVHDQGELSSNGVVLHTHVHSGVQGGSSESGGPKS